MTPEQKAALIISRSVSAFIACQGMIVANKERERHGHAMAYDESVFDGLPWQYGIRESDIATLFDPTPTQSAGA